MIFYCSIWLFCSTISLESFLDNILTIVLTIFWQYFEFFSCFFNLASFRHQVHSILIFQKKIFAYRFLDDFRQTWPLFVSLKRGYYYFSSASYRMHAKEILRTCKSTRVNNTAQSKWKSRHTEIFYFFSFQIVCCLKTPLIWK